MERLQSLYFKMIAYYAHDPRRIQHFVKVHSFARLIGRAEGLEGDLLLTLEAAALVHDIGIRAAEEKYGRCNGKLQEQEGPALAERMLEALRFPPELIRRVCFLVGHHHTYTDVDGVDYRILLEADFLVNLFEDGESDEAVRAAYERIFRTETGKRLCRTMFRL